MNLFLDFLFFLQIKHTNTQTIHGFRSILLTLRITSHDLLNKLYSRAKVQLFPKFCCSRNDLPLKIYTGYKECITFRLLLVFYCVVVYLYIYILWVYVPIYIRVWVLYLSFSLTSFRGICVKKREKRTNKWSNETTKKREWVE